jgi:hypothetical protein
MSYEEEDTCMSYEDEDTCSRMALAQVTEVVAEHGVDAYGIFHEQQVCVCVCECVCVCVCGVCVCVVINTHRYT